MIDGLYQFNFFFHPHSDSLNPQIQIPQDAQKTTSFSLISCQNSFKNTSKLCKSFEKHLLFVTFMFQHFHIMDDEENEDGKSFSCLWDNILNIYSWLLNIITFYYGFFFVSLELMDFLFKVVVYIMNRLEGKAMV